MVSYGGCCKPYETWPSCMPLKFSAFPLSASHFVPSCQPPSASVVLSIFVPDKAGRPSLWFLIWLWLDTVSLHKWEAKHCAAVWRLSKKVSSAVTHCGSHIGVLLPSELLEELATHSLRTQCEGPWGQMCAASLGTGIGTEGAQQASFWCSHLHMSSFQLNRNSGFLQPAAGQFCRTKYVLTLC